MITGTDSDLARSDAPPPADVAQTLAGQLGFARPTKSYGPRRPFSPTGEPGTRILLPQVRRYDLPSARGIVRVEPRQAPIVVDGSAGGSPISRRSAAWRRGRAIQYAADLAPAQLRAALAPGGDVVITRLQPPPRVRRRLAEQNVGADARRRSDRQRRRDHP